MGLITKSMETEERLYYEKCWANQGPLRLGLNSVSSLNDPSLKKVDVNL